MIYVQYFMLFGLHGQIVARRASYRGPILVTMELICEGEFISDVHCKTDDQDEKQSLMNSSESRHTSLQQFLASPWSGAMRTSLLLTAVVTFAVVGISSPVSAASFSGQEFKEDSFRACFEVNYRAFRMSDLLRNCKCYAKLV